VAGKDDWGVGAQEGALLGEYRSGGTGGSHPGIKVPDLPPGVRPISHNEKNKKKKNQWRRIGTNEKTEYNEERVLD